jgi:AcrR family transcriptional regulator
VDRIVAAAVGIADTEGLGALSMRRVAGALGLGAMTLYNHVPGKGELVDLMVDLVLGEVYPAGATGRDAPGPGRLARAAHRDGAGQLGPVPASPWLLRVGRRDRRSART